jgi:hypothetical protein
MDEKGDRDAHDGFLHGWSRHCCCPAASGSRVDLLPHDLSTPETRRKMKMSGGEPTFFGTTRVVLLLFASPAMPMK